MTTPRVVSVEELDLLSFFEVRPTSRDDDFPWPYGSFSYQLARPAFDISFTIWPAYKDVHLIVKSGGFEFELDAKSVEDVQYHKDKGLETLELVMNFRDTVLLQLRPKVRVVHVVRI
jgi:hypothetical protein